MIAQSKAEAMRKLLSLIVTNADRITEDDVRTALASIGVDYDAAKEKELDDPLSDAEILNLIYG